MIRLYSCLHEPLTEGKESSHSHHTPEKGMANQSSCTKAHQIRVPSSISMISAASRTVSLGSFPANACLRFPKLWSPNVCAMRIPTASRLESRSDSQTLCPHNVRMAIVCTVQIVGLDMKLP